MDNIRYGKLDATEEEVIQAAKLANAHEFIMKLSDGYQTVLKGSGSICDRPQAFHDQKFRCDHGRIVERGNHESLLAKKGMYYQLNASGNHPRLC